MENEISLCPSCNCMTKTLLNDKCGKCKKSKRICDFCKKPMFNSWAGKHVGKKFIYIHNKCKKDWDN